ncbi:DUF4091 domain-containing protein [Paenibacillus sp. 1P07SE]|uniref:DUF4091 domain-containing protein n=1 Tax=Paenibacillus sp. 1P07SE TaxID=3132209 RepID=UPI0039A77CB6
MDQSNLSFETRCISALEKVFADEALQADTCTHGTALIGETYSFQIAFRAQRTIKLMKLRIESSLDASLFIRSVGLVPSELPCYTEHDDNVLRTTPGLYPDPLYPVEDAPPVALARQWRSIWVGVKLPEDIGPGTYPVGIVFEDEQGAVLGGETFTLEVLPAKLQPQRLIHTEWFHADCLAVQYGVEAFSEAHWTLIDAYVRKAVEYGMNMILTPLFTPPLDTAIGGERPTVQLVDVEQLVDGLYRFSFDKLLRWIALCSEAGVQYFEFSQLFTQWGAKHAPKIMATTPEGMVRIFGWDTDAAGPEYAGFLEQLLPELTRLLDEHGLRERSCFHLSDEPSAQHLYSYRAAAAVALKHLEGFTVLDALSDYSFYEQGLVRKPVPAVDHLDAFLERGVPDLWTYYCCAQSREVANRFFNMPSARNRILGIQLYKYQITGFLHWGYNFWFSQYSKVPVDPFRVTDAGLAFPSGDPFLVYPGPDGPIESIRLLVLHDALQDLRALQQLERLVGRERVLELLEEDMEEELTLKQYPRDPKWLLDKRERVNRLIAEQSMLLSE